MLDNLRSDEHVAYVYSILMHMQKQQKLPGKNTSF